MGATITKMLFNLLDVWAKNAILGNPDIDPILKSP